MLCGGDEFLLNIQYLEHTNHSGSLLLVSSDGCSSATNQVISDNKMRQGAAQANRLYPGYVK